MRLYCFGRNLTHRCSVISVSPVCLLSVAFAVLALGGCTGSLRVNGSDDKTPASVTSGEFRFFGTETTGLNEHLLLPDGSELNITFSPRSDQSRMRLLRALRYCDIVGTKGESLTTTGHTIDQRIFVIGEILPKVLRTTEAVNRPGPEEYREFILRDWYIETPFSAITPPPIGEEAPPRIRPETSLSAACPSIAEQVELDRYVRHRP